MQQLAGVSNVVCTAVPLSSCLLVECYCDHVAEAAVLLSAFGGEMSELRDRDWVAATAPEHTPPLIIRNRLVVVSSPALVLPMQQRYPGRQVLCFPAERAFAGGRRTSSSTSNA